MTLTTAQKLDAATRLIKAVTGEPYGDGEIVTNVGVGYANGDDDAVWVTGNWNDVDRYDVDQKKRVFTSTLPGRLFDALQRIGVEGEWLDEWNTCDHCQKLIRTQPDSYGWTPDYVIWDNEYICKKDAISFADQIIDDEYANHVDRAVTWLDENELVALGWVDAMPNERDAASGMHPGQDDTPRSIVDAWRATLTDDEVHQKDYVFLITDKGQFDVHYRLFTRASTTTEGE